MVPKALRMWKELEQETDTKLFRLVCAVELGVAALIGSDLRCAWFLTVKLTLRAADEGRSDRANGTRNSMFSSKCPIANWTGERVHERALPVEKESKK